MMIPIIDLENVFVQNSAVIERRATSHIVWEILYIVFVNHIKDNDRSSYALSKCTDFDP